MITVYHGTALPLAEKIIKSSGLAPKPGNKYVYVTTDKKVAETYARAWTAWYMYDAAPELKIKNPKPIGGIIKLELPEKYLEEDPYNPEGEPNQYRVRAANVSAVNLFVNKIKPSLEKIDFPKLKDETELLRAYCYWIGIARATDESAAPRIMKFDKFIGS